MKSDALQTMRTSVSYLERECFAPLRELPLSLTQGDVHTNLQALIRSPTDKLCALTKKVRSCAMVFPSQAAEGVKLLQQAPTSIQLVEKRRGTPVVLGFAGTTSRLGSRCWQSELW